MSTLHPSITGRRSGTTNKEEARLQKARPLPNKKKVKKPRLERKAKKPRLERKAKKARPERKEMVKAKRAASAMATVEELAAALGIGRNQAYELVNGKKRDPLKGTPDEPPKVPSLRFGRRHLIPRSVIDKLVAGEFDSAAARSDAA